MPDVVATQFDGSGKAQGFSSKPALFFVYGAIIVINDLLFWLLPLKLHRLPPASLRLPNSDYWLSERQRAASLEFLKNQLMGFGIAGLALAVTVMELLVAANRVDPPRLSGLFLWLLLGYAFFVTLWSVRTVRRFRSPVVPA